MDYSKQVDKEHYNFKRYFFPGRWMSYYYQVREFATRDDIKTALDIGPGTDFLKHTLGIHCPNVTYKTVDVAEDVKPDFIGGITKLPLEDASYDVVCAFQVLEHIEFSDVEKALLEMSRVSKKYIFISLPHYGPSIEFLLKLPFLPRFMKAWKLPHHPVHAFNGQHYWEIGKKGYSVRTIRTLMQKHFEIIDEYVPFEYQYHRFFIMKKK